MTVTDKPAPRPDPVLARLDLVSMAEAGAILGVTKQAVSLLILGGRLRAARVGTAWILRRAEVERHRDL